MAKPHNWERIPNETPHDDAGYWWCDECETFVVNFVARSGSPVPTPPAKLVIGYGGRQHGGGERREGDAEWDAHDCDAVKQWTRHVYD